MTMPQYMNCMHRGDGWCLACVARQVETDGDVISRTTSELVKANAEIASLRQLADAVLRVREQQRFGFDVLASAEWDDVVRIAEAARSTNRDLP